MCYISYPPVRIVGLAFLEYLQISNLQPQVSKSKLKNVSKVKDIILAYSQRASRRTNWGESICMHVFGNNTKTILDFCIIDTLKCKADDAIEIWLRLNLLTVSSQTPCFLHISSELCLQ